MTDERIAYWREQGRCPACREHRPLAEGRAYCAECLAYWRQRQRDLRKKREDSRLCIVCGKPLPDGSVKRFCQTCGERDNRVSMKNRQARIDAGRCVVCGAPLGKQDMKTDGSYYRRCFKCRVRKSEYDRAWMAKKKEAAEREREDV